MVKIRVLIIISAATIDKVNAVFPKWSGTFNEFSEYDKSLKHELGSI